jgi:hypothetical protein
MITKLIAALIIALLLFGAYEIVQYYATFENEKAAQQAAAAAKVVTGDQLSGMPYELQSSLAAAQQAGPKAFANWLAMYGRSVQDPRLAWIQLDYCLAISRENPAEAKKIFAAVKDRTPSSSPVYPRIQELAKSYQ